ncbi:MAG: bifunctional aspartate kinase/homoserine dehydrogenase I, partial [Cyclobacteriaceae bacterium]
SKKMHFSGEEGIDLADWQEKLDAGEKQTIQNFYQRMVQMNLRNSVFLDVTASKSVPMLYPEVLKKSISIATPNKIAATDLQEKYLHLKRLERKYKTQFLFETNVCAGLPVISTLSDLVKSGDRIHRIEAVLSGTLNFLFNNYDGSSSFSSIVRRAKDEGFSEPDPRLDLSGQDVMRKILILVRESGYSLEMDQIVGKGFVPEACMKAKNVEEFFELVENEEAHFQHIVAEAKSQGKRIKYVAKFEEGQASTGLEYVDSKHPFYNLEGSDNIVLFYTDRYTNQPLVIKGAGAGAEVTASGIFADIMRVASSN